MRSVVREDERGASTVFVQTPAETYRLAHLSPLIPGGLQLQSLRLFLNAGFLRCAPFHLDSSELLDLIEEFELLGSGLLNPIQLPMQVLELLEALAGVFLG